MSTKDMGPPPGFAYTCANMELLHEPLSINIKS